MATTVPTEFVGKPKLTKKRLKTIEDWYQSSLGDSDKCDNIEDANFYEGEVVAFESVLRLLHGMPLDDEDDD